MMFAAGIWHISRKETPNVVFNAILLVMALFIVYGGFVAVSS